MQRDLAYYGDAVLRETSEPVTAITEEIRALARDLIETMRAERGVGLAAQQVGRTEAICVIEVPASLDVDDAGVRLHPDLAMPLVLVNPRITAASAECETRDEGCLSFPDIVAPIERASQVTVDFMDMDGRNQTLVLRGFVARAAQHEIDHLNGVLLVDRMSRIKRIALGGQLKRLKKRTQMAVS